MKLKALLVALPIAVLAMLGAQGAGHAATEQPTPVSAEAAQDEKTVSVSIHTDNGANGLQVAHAINNIHEDNADKFVQKAVDEAFAKSGSRFNVIMMNLSQGYTHSLQGIRLYANVRFGYKNYGLWIAEAGSFTNTGNGGWENWGFRGWWTRNGMTVNFRRP